MIKHQEDLNDAINLVYERTGLVLEVEAATELASALLEWGESLDSRAATLPKRAEFAWLLSRWLSQVLSWLRLAQSADCVVQDVFQSSARLAHRHSRECPGCSISVQVNSGAQENSSSRQQRPLTLESREVQLLKLYEQTAADDWRKAQLWTLIAVGHRATPDLLIWRPTTLQAFHDPSCPVHGDDQSTRKQDRATNSTPSLQGLQSHQSPHHTNRSCQNLPLAHKRG